MPKNTLFSTWVKNVYSLCVEGVVICVRSYTGLADTRTHLLSNRVQPSTFTHIMDSFTPSLYTPIFSALPQVNTHLYTLSTVPTIKKNKKK